MTKKLFTDEVETSNRKIVEVNEDFAVVEVQASKGEEIREDILNKVPLTVEALKKKFTDEEIFKLAIRQYFTEQINSLRDNGYCRENKEIKERAALLNSMTPDEIKELLSEDQIAELFGN